MSKNPGRYEDCLKTPGDVKCLEDIKKDIHRQFPTHEMFNSEDKPGCVNPGFGWSHVIFCGFFLQPARAIQRAQSLYSH